MTDTQTTIITLDPEKLLQELQKTSQDFKRRIDGELLLLSAGIETQTKAWEKTKKSLKKDLEDELQRFEETQK